MQTRRLRPRNWPLATKLALLFVVWAIVPLTLVTLYNDATTQAQLLAEVQAENLQRARGTAEVIDAYLAERLADIRLAAVTPDVIRFLQNPQDWILRAASDQWLRQICAIYGYDAIYVTNKSGAVLISTDDRFLGRSYLTARWFRNAVAGQTTIDEPRYDPEDGEFYLHFSAPVRAPSGMIVGAVISRVRLDALDRLVAVDTGNADWGNYGVLWDDVGVRLSDPAHPDRRFRPFAPLPTDVVAALIAEARFGPATGELLRGVGQNPEVLDQSRLLLYDPAADPHVFFTCDVHGPTHGVSVPLQTKRWLYGIFTPETHIVGALHAQTQRALLVALLAGLTAAAAAFATARWVTRPVRQVADAAKAIAAGDMARRVGLAQRDEVGQLAAAFDAMTEALAEKEAQLRRYAGHLEQLVEERTAALRAQTVHLETLSADRLRLLEQTQAQAHQVQQIMDSVPVGVLLLDADHRIRQANPAARAYLAALAGNAPDDTLTHLGGRPIAALLEPPPPGSGYHEVSLTGIPPQTFEIEARPINLGAEDGWVLVLRDVTAERETQQRIQQQERLAAVGQLAAGIAHDFNNILTSIIGYTQLLSRQPDMPEVALDQLSVIEQQGRRAAQLIRQILDFSRQSIVHYQAMDLEPFLKETCKLLERTLPENIRIAVEFESGEYVVNVDPAQMQQVLTNLAVNARDAMPNGGELRFRLARRTFAPGAPRPLPELAPGDWLVLDVADTGTGIPPEVLPHIFEPFFTTKGVGKGTGLGLSQVYGIVRQHGGQIDVHSQVGQGAAFTIYLPALPSTKTTARLETARPVPRGHGEVLLLVEDEPAVLQVGRAMLELLGYQVLTAVDGQEALAVYANRGAEIALVLTDLMMPTMGGAALYQALKERDPEIKMIVLTGYPLEEESQSLLTRGVVVWMQKPLHLEQLAQAVSRALGQ